MNRKLPLFVLLLTFVLGLAISPAVSQQYKFAVMSDTQWPTSPDHKNPNGTAIDIVNHLNDEFVKHGVKFVIQVGDLTDNGSVNNNLELLTRVTFAQTLYNKGIGYYPLRGNHESAADAATAFVKIFPQTFDGRNNMTPDWAFVTFPPDDPPYPVPPAKEGDAFTVGSNFSSPNSNLAGLTYSFDYQNARFVLLDTFTVPNVSCNLIEDQQAWITNTLSTRDKKSTHAFVFSHKGLQTEDHKDILFTAPGKCNGSSTNGTPAVKPDLQNIFFASLAQNGVRYYMGGHDHMHNRAILSSPDNNWTVENIIASSNSYKFYIPADYTNNASPTTTNDYVYNMPAFGRTRETQVSQELGTVGYYIFTVDGPRVTVDFYSSPNCAAQTCDTADQSTDLIPFQFSKRETFGYSLNGQQFLIPQGGTYTKVKDSFGSTTAQILDGANGSTMLDFNSRQLTKTLNTGWSGRSGKLVSNVLTLWGMTENLGSCSAPCKPAANVANETLYGLVQNPISTTTDVFALSMNFIAMNNTRNVSQYALVARNADGVWVNAVDLNVGGTKRRIDGPYQQGYGLGTYGVDPSTGTAWAVINYNGDFSVTSNLSN